MSGSVTKTADVADYRRFLRLGAIIALAWSVFQLYVAAFGAPHQLVFRPMHVALATALVFVAFPVVRSWRKRGAPVDEADEEGGEQSTSRDEPMTMTVVDVVLASLALAIGLFYVANTNRISERVTFIDDVLVIDVIVGLGLMLLVLEACRRVVGASLTIVAGVFLAYQFFGQHLPGVLGHAGMPLDRFIDFQALSAQGLFGVPTGVAADYVFYFILFAAFLEISGGGRLFIDIALALTGRLKGGPAKAAVVGSAMMGSINGSAVANVVSTGVFTIPMMKRSGFKARFAAGVEAMASTGGQLLPPIMGAGAFVMAQMLGMPYSDVVIAAIIPAVLYFLSGFLMVDKVARRDDIRPIDAGDRIGFHDISRRIHLLIPLVYLTYLILSGRSLMASAFQAVIAVVIVAFFRRATWFTPHKILVALEMGARRSVNVALPCAVAGIVVGVITQTNLGLRFTELVLAMSGGHLIPALLLVMIGTIILGMGMPTTSAYIMAAVLMAPPLAEVGVPTLAAHLFIFYFACLSMITPPVALASFAAAGIARSKIFPTSIQAFVVSLAAYIVPFAFVMSPELLLQGGDIWRIVWFTGTAAFGIYLLAATVIGYEAGRISVGERVLTFALAIALVYPGMLVSACAGAVAAVYIAARHVRARRRGANRAPESEDHLNHPNIKETTDAH